MKIFPPQQEVLAFDWGTAIIGILDVTSGTYTPYRANKRMIEGAKRLTHCAGTIVSFNGNGRDLFEIATLLGARSVAELSLRGNHDDMAEIISRIRWPPSPGTAPIVGPCLSDTYAHYFGDVRPIVPSALSDEYEADNWIDCYRTAELWRKWKRDGLEGS